MPEDIAVVELRDNAAVGVFQHKFSKQKVEALLQHRAKLDSEISAALGFPIALVPVDPDARWLIPPNGPLFSSNPHNNRAATWMAARVDTGLAPGAVVGHVYAIRKDFKSFTVAEWARLDDVGFNMIMDAFGDEEPVTMDTYRRAKEAVEWALVHDPYRDGSHANSDDDEDNGFKGISVD